MDNLAAGDVFFCRRTHKGIVAPDQPAQSYSDRQTASLLTYKSMKLFLKRLTVSVALRSNAHADLELHHLHYKLSR